VDTGVERSGGISKRSRRAAGRSGDVI